MKVIRDLLAQLEILEPIPTGLQPIVNKDNTIKLVAFDIYGTLLISSAGDIDDNGHSVTWIEKTMQMCDIVISKHVEKDKILSLMLEKFYQSIQNIHTIFKNSGIDYPEVDILEVCQKMINFAENEGWIEYKQPSDCKTLSFVLELLSNPVYPMPRFKETIFKLHTLGYPLGIVSNAQFYTPVVMNYYLNDFLTDSEYVYPFDNELIIFSFKLRRAKPDFLLFEKLIPILDRKYHLKPSEILFIGNDMLKDIFPAHEVGFKTALFAGDKRSLKLREGDDRVKDLKPDFLITELKQVFDILNIDGS